MNEERRAELRQQVWRDDDGTQREWFAESLEAHKKNEQRLIAKFRLADMMGDTDELEKISKVIVDVRVAIKFLQEQLK